MAYSRPLLGATIAPNLVPQSLKKKLSLEMVKNGICFRGANKQNALSLEDVPWKKPHPYPQYTE